MGGFLEGGDPETLPAIEMASSSNAASPLSVPTYDNNGFVVHPDVVYVPGGWNGYTYWMVYNTYYNQDQKM